jgi:hypothetical protein
MPKSATPPTAGSTGCSLKRVPRRLCTALIPSEQERQHSLGFENVGRDSLFPFIAERIQVIWDGIFQAMRRFFLMLAWWPFLLSDLMPFVSDGLARRKVKQSNFDYSSPLVHRYSFFALLGILYLLLII